MNLFKQASLYTVFSYLNVGINKDFLLETLQDKEDFLKFTRKGIY